MARIMACCLLLISALVATPPAIAQDKAASTALLHDSMFAASPGAILDSKTRTPVERAQMLKNLGFRKVALNWQWQNLAEFELEIDAIRSQGLEILSIGFRGPDDPSQPIDWGMYKLSDAVHLGDVLEVLKLRRLRPQLWISRNARTGNGSPSPGVQLPVRRTFEEQNEGYRAQLDPDLRIIPGEQKARIRREADHFKSLAKFISRAGMPLGFYKHGGWFGMSDNQLAIVELLKAEGVRNVGIVYRFIRAHDEFDETADFAARWTRLKPHVLAVELTGVHANPRQIFPILYPSQGQMELGMMKVIQESGWNGPVGLSAEIGFNLGNGKDAEVNLRNNIIGLDWLAKELTRSGSGGARPFPMP